MTTGPAFNGLDQLAAKLRAAQQVVVLTGAGISAESGLATFRDPLTGLWARFKPEDLGTPEAFRKNPRLVWNWYAARRRQAAAATPNPGHTALVAIEQRGPRFTLLTQNVDGLHQRAGSQNIIELHGNIHRVKCFDQHHPVESWPETDKVPPPCPICGSLLRPDVVWFHEMLPPAALDRATYAAQTCDLFLAVGTSLRVYPAAALPLLALDRGATVATISLDVLEGDDPPVLCITGKAGEVLPTLVRQTWPDVQLPNPPPD